MKKIFVTIVILSSLLLVVGCGKEKQDERLDVINLENVVSTIENKNNLVEYKNGTMEISYVEHNDLEDKTIQYNDVENLLKLLNYSEETTADFRGPSSITIKYTNEENNAYEFKIWSNNIYEYGQLGQPCPEMNCTKFYKIKSDFNMIEYFEEVYREE